MPAHTRYVVYIVLNFLNSLLLIPATLWHYRHNNASAAALGTWFFISLQLVAINAMIWYGDNDNKAPLFCDISVKVEGASSFGTVISAFFVAQNLAAAVQPNAGIRTEVDRKQAMKEYALYFGLPLVLMATQPLYQYGRFEIVENLGCRRYAQNNFFFVYIQILLPVYIILAAAGYMGYASFRVWMNRIHLKRISENAGMSTARFIRIICVCWTYILLALIFFFFGSFATLLDKSIGWTSNLTVHPENFTHVFQSTNGNGPTVAQWNTFVTTIPYTVFFGFSPEMLGLYRHYLNKFRKTKPAPARKEVSVPVVAPLGEFVNKDSTPANKHEISLDTAEATDGRI